MDLIKLGSKANVNVMLFSSNHRITRNKSGKQVQGIPYHHALELHNLNHHLPNVCQIPFFDGLGAMHILAKLVF